MIKMTKEKVVLDGREMCREMGWVSYHNGKFFTAEDERKIREQQIREKLPTLKVCSTLMTTKGTPEELRKYREDL